MVMPFYPTVASNSFSNHEDATTALSPPPVIKHNKCDKHFVCNLNVALYESVNFVDQKLLTTCL